MIWEIFLLVTILSWGAYNLFFKVIEPSMNYFLVLAIIGLTQAILCLPFLIYYKNINEIIISQKGFLLSVIMGILLGIGTIAFFYTFKMGANTSVAIPVYTIGALIIGFLGGILLFNESVSIKPLIGLLLGLISIIFLNLK